MLFILTVLAVIIADVYGESFKQQQHKNTNFMGQHDDCTATVPGKDKNATTVLLCVPGVKKAFSIVNEYWIKGPIWNDQIASEALEEALKQNSTDADYKIRQKKKFLKGEKTTMAQKAVKALYSATPYYYMEQKSSICPCIPPKEVIRRIPSSVYYGCNGIFDTEGKDDVLTVVCLYRSKLRKRVLHKYKNIEVKGFN